jgi:hypothetical protein
MRRAYCPKCEVFSCRPETRACQQCGRPASLDFVDVAPQTPADIVEQQALVREQNDRWVRRRYEKRTAVK